MARVALREKIVVGLMMEGGSWVSMVVTGWVVVYREIWKGRKSSRNGGICKWYTVQTLGDAT